jgi:hypothetical protein
MFEHGSAPLPRYRDSRLTTLAGAGGTRRKLRPVSGGVQNIRFCRIFSICGYRAILSHARNGPHGPVPSWC